LDSAVKVWLSVNMRIFPRPGWHSQQAKKKKKVAKYRRAQ
jgi:hypothetical protein